MEYRDIIESWRRKNNKTEPEMAMLLGLGNSQQNYNDFKTGRKKTFPFEVAIEFKKISGINLLEDTTESRNNLENSVSINVLLNLSESNKTLVNSNKLAVETNSKLVERILSLSVPGEVSPVFPVTKSGLYNPVEELKPGKGGKRSVGIHGNKKGSGSGSD